MHTATETRMIDTISSTDHLEHQLRDFARQIGILEERITLASEHNACLDRGITHFSLSHANEHLSLLHWLNTINAHLVSLEQRLQDLEHRRRPL
jgi:hypothetical protein